MHINNCYSDILSISESANWKKKYYELDDGQCYKLYDDSKKSMLKK